MKLNLLVLRSSEMEETKAFYASLGANFVCEQHDGGPEHYAAVLDDGIVLRVYPESEKPAKSRLRLGFSVDSVPKVIRRLGLVEIAGAKYIIRDTDGTMVELYQAKNEIT